MSDEKKYTEREMVSAQRQAFDAGAVYGHVLGCEGTKTSAEAAKRYPLPRVTRPRVVRGMAGDCWRIDDGELQIRWGGKECWRPAVHVTDIDADALRRLADLLANPTETVEDTE